MNDKKGRLTPVYSDFLNRRNGKILQLRKQGWSLKSLAAKFNLSIRHINRIINKMSKNV